MTVAIETSWIDDIGKPAAESIVEMVAALECDYDRLEALRDERYANDSPQAWVTENPNDAEELATLESEAGECEDQDQARERITEDALSVEVRSGWHSPGDDNGAEDFCILLSTGGPAVRIRGELNEYREPHRAWLEVQDWFKPWTEYHGIKSATLLAYAQCFYFGE